MKKQLCTSIDDSLYKVIKIHAVETNKAFNEIFEKALRLYLSIEIFNDFKSIAKSLPVNTTSGIMLRDFCYKNIKSDV